MKEVINKSALQLTASIKDMDIKQGIVTGYAASFNTLDSDGDIITPGAFAKTISDQGPDSVQPRIKHLLNHNTSQPLGKPLILKEYATGLYYESKIGSNDVAVDFMKMVDSGLITEHSIGFSTIQRQSNQDGTTLLKELKLWEFSSLTAWGANQFTPLIGVKELPNIKNRIERLLSACKSGTFTDTTFTFLEQELLYLQKAFTDISTQPEPIVVAIVPEPVHDFADAIKSFTSSLI